MDSGGAPMRRLNVLARHLPLPPSAAAPARPAPVAEEMKDEYSNIGANGDFWTVPSEFPLECGQGLKQCEVCYNTYGVLNEERDNCIFACHAATGNSQVADWWGELIGPGKPIDTEKYFVVCANTLASPYGTTSPLSTDPATGQPFGPSYPAVTIRDTVRLHRRLVFDHLRVRSVALVIGGSMGGMQALEWLLLSGEEGPAGEPDVRKGIVIACGAAHTSWQIGISETQRNAIYSDPRWNGGSYEKANPPTTGLAIARQIAMITYRTSAAYHTKFPRDSGGLAHRGLGLPKFPRLPFDDGTKWEVQSYLDHQGEKFRNRFDPLTYVRLTAMMDTHDVCRGRGDCEKSLSGISQPVAVVAINSDVLYPIHEQQELVRRITNSEMWLVDSMEGHDAFLLETEQIAKVCSRMLDSGGWVPRRDTTTYCTTFVPDDAVTQKSQEELDYHEQQAAAHRALGTFHEQLKEKPKARLPFWL